MNPVLHCWVPYGITQSNSSSQYFTDWHLPTQRTLFQIVLLAKISERFCIHLHASGTACMADVALKSSISEEKLLSVILPRRSLPAIYAPSWMRQGTSTPWGNRRWARGEKQADESNSVTGYFTKILPLEGKVFCHNRSKQLSD